MNFWLFSLIARILGGEPYERSTKVDICLWGSAFASFPAFLALFILLFSSLDRAPAWEIWLAGTLLASVGFFLWLGLLRRFPVWALVALAAGTWPSLALMIWTR